MFCMFYFFPPAGTSQINEAAFESDLHRTCEKRCIKYFKYYVIPFKPTNE